MEPIEELNAPKTRRIVRYSFFFVGGVAQDFNLDPDSDTVAETEIGWIFRFIRAGVVLREEEVQRRNVCWHRKQALDVPMRQPGRREPPVSQ